MYGSRAQPSHVKIPVRSSHLSTMLQVGPPEYKPEPEPEPDSPHKNSCGHSCTVYMNLRQKVSNYIIRRHFQVFLLVTLN